MALGDSYATVAELKGYLQHITDTTDDTQLSESLAVATSDVNDWCSRQFNKTTTATARVFHPSTWTKLELLDGSLDFHTITDLIIKTDSGDDGTYETTLTSSQYSLEPLNGIVDGETGWPYHRIRLVNTTFPMGSTRPSVQVTAQWGWNAVPVGVKMACIHMASEIFKLKGAPFGVANTDQFGPIRVRDNPRVQRMLRKYRLAPILVG